MLHLFNKVYLEFDTNIEINFDRVVMSERYGIPMLQQLDKIAYGELIAFGKSYDEVVGNDFAGFIATLKDFGNTSGKKVIVYCDNESYKKVVANWFKTTLPNLDLDTFKNIVNFTMYNQRIVSNTQLSSVHSTDLNSLWGEIGEVDEAWEAAVKVDKKLIDNLELKHSYEFLAASYLADGSKKEELRGTIHMFLRRWFKEMFTDNRQMVLFNITNHKFLSAMDIDPELIDITRLDPLSGVPGLEAYADDEIWERDQVQYGICNLEGLDKEKLDLLKNTILTIFDKFENMLIDRSIFEILSWIEYAAADNLSDEQMEEVLSYFVNNPFDTVGIPRFDFQNVNFPLFQYFLAQKFNGEDLSKYRLL